jgi:hypothetical protein
MYATSVLPAQPRSASARVNKRRSAAKCAVQSPNRSAYEVPPVERRTLARVGLVLTLGTV